MLLSCIILFNFYHCSIFSKHLNFILAPIPFWLKKNYNFNWKYIVWHRNSIAFLSKVMLTKWSRAVINCNFYLNSFHAAFHFFDRYSFSTSANTRKFLNNSNLASSCAVPLGKSIPLSFLRLFSVPLILYLFGRHMAALYI